MNSEGQGQLHAHSITRFERLSILLIVALSVGAILWMGRDSGHHARKATSAIIFEDGRPITELNLLQNKIVTLPSKQLEIEVNEGRVRVARSNCPKQVCVRSGWIKESGEIIVCVPNKILIEVRSSDRPLLDAVVR